MLIEQTRKDRADNIELLRRIASGDLCYTPDGIENTAFRKADAERRLADCEAILVAYA